LTKDRTRCKGNLWPKKRKGDRIAEKERSLNKLEAKLIKDREKFKELTREMLRKEAALKKIEDEYSNNVSNLKQMEQQLSSANLKLAMNQEKIRRLKLELELRESRLKGTNLSPLNKQEQSKQVSLFSQFQSEVSAPQLSHSRKQKSAKEVSISEYEMMPSPTRTASTVTDRGDFQRDLPTGQIEDAPKSPIAGGGFFDELQYRQSLKTKQDEDLKVELRKVYNTSLVGGPRVKELAAKKLSIITDLRKSHSR